MADTNIFPNKKYSIIYADPPWRYNDKGCNGAAEKHYDTMSLREMCGLPVKDIAEKDCVLFMWATYPNMIDAFELLSAWEFEYKTVAFQWVKLNKSGNGYFFGLGHWTRGNTEPCLIATKGKPRRINSSIRQLVFSPIGIHSRKPYDVRERIVELMGDLPRIELFAREAAPGWDCWGKEVK